MGNYTTVFKFGEKMTFVWRQLKREPEQTIRLYIIVELSRAKRAQRSTMRKKIVVNYPSEKIW